VPFEGVAIGVACDSADAETSIGVSRLIALGIDIDISDFE
jgi:hypothetical protein